MERHEESIKFFILMCTVLMYSYCLYKFLSSAMFVIIEVFYVVYDFLSYDDNMQNDNEIIAEDTLDNDNDMDDIDMDDIDMDDNDMDDIDMDDIDTDPIENSKIENDIKTRVKYEDEDEEFEVDDIQEILQDTVFKNVTMKQLTSRCNKQSIRCIREFHKCKSLNKVQLIMAFMHTHIYRYYNSKTASTIYFSLYNYLNCKMESYGFKNASYYLYKNLTPDDIDKYINYYFDIAIIVDC
jgi:hypothetical protein